jgi:ATP-binding cassette, subfamily B, multidrug efflux pump
VEESKQAKMKKGLDAGMIRRIFAYTKPYRGKFYIAVVITLTLSALSIARPLIIQQIIDKHIVGKDSEMLLIMTCVLLGTLITEAVLQFANIFLTSFIGQNIIRDLRSQVYNHILHFRTKYFDNTPIGTLVTRSVSDIESLADVFSQGFIVILGDILTLLVFITTMFIVNWQLAFLVLTTIPLLLIATSIFKKGVKSSFTEVRNAVSALNAFVQEHIQGMKVVQIFNREQEEYKKFEAINENHKKANIRSIWFYSIFFPVVEILSSIAIGLIIWYAGVRLGKMNITAGEITFFIMLTNMLFRPIRMLADRLNTLQMGIVAAERVFAVLDNNEQIPNEGKLSSATIKGDIEFNNVSFAYNDDDYVLKNISFHVNHGETRIMVKP